MQAICFRTDTYQLEGLTVAIIVVFELPPRESCQCIDQGDIITQQWEWKNNWGSSYREITTCKRKVSFESR
jgi:hypothetical protein